jgi:hypothetical protein
MDAYQLRGSRATCGRCTTTCQVLHFNVTHLNFTFNILATSDDRIVVSHVFFWGFCNCAPPSGHPLADCNLILADFIVNKRCRWHLPIPNLIYLTTSSWINVVVDTFRHPGRWPNPGAWIAGSEQTQLAKKVSNVPHSEFAPRKPTEAPYVSTIQFRAFTLAHQRLCGW